MARLALLAGASLISVVPRLAGAAEHVAAPEPLVIVISSSPDAPFVRRLAAELSLFGYRVQVSLRRAADGDLPGWLERSGGAALIAVDQGRQTVDVIVASSEDAPRQERERLDPRRQAETNAAVLAERFRARLTELGIAPASAPSFANPVAVPRPVPVRPVSVAQAPERRLWLAGGFGATDGGLGFHPDAQLEIRAFPFLWMSTSAFAKVSLAPARLRQREGEADVGIQSGGILIDFYPVRRDWVLKAGIGALLVNAEMSGESSGAWDGRSVSVLVPAGVVDVGGAWRLSPRVSVELTAFVGACSPRIGISFAGRSVAHYGRPLVGSSLGLAVGVF